MSDTIETTATEQTSRPVERKESFTRAVFGQFTDPTFWRDLLKLVVSEMINSFLAALGGTLLYYGSKRRDSKIAEMTGMAMNGQASPMAQKAFGGAYQPTPSYQPSNSYPVPTSSPSGDARFPGFGSPR